MKRIFLMIPLAIACGCSQTREERRDTVKTILWSPLLAAAWYLDHQEKTDPLDDMQTIVDRQNNGQLPAGAATTHVRGNHPDVE